MAEQTRDTLSKYFQAGELPTQGHFGDLIDSMLNMKDEGFRKSAKNGMEVASLGNEDALLSFYRDSAPTDALWALRYGDNNRLVLGKGSRHPAERVPAALTLDTAALNNDMTHQARVGVNTAAPQHTLDVAGVVAAQGRVGSYNAGAALVAPADGEWHDILSGLQGCQAFEVMAGVGGGEGSGRFALLHAVALNTYNPSLGWFDWLAPKRRIRATRAHYGKRCDRLHLCWEGSSGKDASYALRIKTHCHYGPGVNIRFNLTQLWSDASMASCLPTKTTASKGAA